MTKKLGQHKNNAPRDGKPRVHQSAELRDCVLGQFTDVAPRVVMAECELGDYSYLARGSEAIYATIGKFCCIAANVRINAVNHPMQRISQHNITYRPNEFFLFAKVDKEFRQGRKQARVVIGHDVWIGHGAIIMPGVKIGHGAVIAAGAVVTKSVEAYAVVAGVPAKRIKWRFSKALRAKIIKLKWWDWPHEKLATAVEDMRELSPQDFIAKWQSKA